MPRHSGVLADVAGAILDGTPIDWASAESSAEQIDRALLEPLRIVAAVADLHRRLPPRPGISPAPGQSASDPLVPQKHWGHLRVLERVGRGTFGRVYRAWDTRLDREVALKLLPAGPAASDARTTSIIEEGRLLARVRHPNVVSIYGAERIGEHVGLWMEFVDGHTLEQLLEQGRVFDQKQAVEIGIQLCQAVAAVHQAGLLHRDIKAHNVMLTNENRVVLMDFGTGRALGDGPAAAIAGTPLYLAPEVLAGGETTVASDIYGIGVLLYHLLTGSYPVPASSLADLRSAHQRGDRADLVAARPDLSSKLVRIIQRASDPEPARRQPSATTLASDLESLQPRSKLIPLAYAAAVAATLVVVVWIAADIRSRRNQEPGSPAAVAGGAVPSPAERPIIAVLPFKNLSSEPDSDHFVDGLTDELIRNLAVIDGLAVRSQTSSFSFKDKPRNLRDVGEQLGANLVVEGSVLRSGNQLRINAQLVQVANDVPLWSDRFNRELKDVFAIQDEIARAIVNRLRLTLGRGQRRYDTNLEAYDLYLKARAMAARRGGPSGKVAAELFEQVIEKDPQFAPAFAGLADAYAFMSTGISGGVSPAFALSRMRPAASRALELDPLLAEAHAAMGIVSSRELAWADAEKSFERAIDLNPVLTSTYTNYSLSTLIPLGKLDKAERLVQTALANDPLSLEARRELAWVQFTSGRYDEAIDNLKRVAADDPTFPFVLLFLARALTAAERVEEALPLWPAVSIAAGVRGPHENLPGNQFQMALTYVKAGRRAQVEKWAATNDHPFRLAYIYAALGDKDRALEALDRAADIVPQRVSLFVRYPESLPLRDDPRFAAICKKLRLPVISDQ